MSSSIINSLLRDWGTDPLFLLAVASLPLLIGCVLPGRSKAKRRWLAAWRWLAAGLWLLCVLTFSAPLIVNPQVDAWEMRYAADGSCEASSPIVVLGAGLNRAATTANQTEYLYFSSHIRIARTADLALAYPQAMVITAGAGVASITEAEMMREYLLQRGVNSERILLDSVSRNTYENALNVAELLEAKDLGQRFRLVTSALHMPRAMGVFETQGLSPCAIPVDYVAVKPVPWYAIAPQTTAIAKFRTYLHERIGYRLYKAKGWIDQP